MTGFRPTQPQITDNICGPGLVSGNMRLAPLKHSMHVISKRKPRKWRHTFRSWKSSKPLEQHLEGIGQVRVIYRPSTAALGFQREGQGKK